MNNNLIIQHLKDKYNIEITNVIIAQRGFVAETFIAINKKTNQKYFLKLVKKSRYDENLKESLPVLDTLYHQANISEINYPIKAIDNNLYSDFGDYTFIVFNFIEGKWVKNYPGEEILEILYKIHVALDKIKVKIKTEKFTTIYSKKLFKLLKKIKTQTFSNKIEIKTQQYIKSLDNYIDETWENFQTVIKICKKTNFQTFITHGDPIGNVIKGNDGKLYIIDWDDILLAPAERDLWFEYEREDFIDQYKNLNSNYEFKPLAYKFYVYQRHFYDLYGFLIEIYDLNASVTHKKKNYNLLKNDWGIWTMDLIKKFN